MSLQAFLNGWVKTNKQHVVFPGKESQDGRRFKDRTSSIESFEQNNKVHKRRSIRSTENDRHGRDNDTAVTVSSSTRQQRSVNKMDPENKAIQRFISRKDNRRLQRSISHSDLLRELAQEKRSKPKKRNGSSTLGSKSSSKDSSSATRQSGADTVHHKNHNRLQEDSKSITDQSAVSALSGGSLPLLYNLFGDDSKKEKIFYKNETPPPPLHQHVSTQIQTPATTGKYLNEIAFVQQYQQQKQVGSKSPSRSTTTSASSRRSKSKIASRDPSVSSSESGLRSMHEVPLTGGSSTARSAAPGGSVTTQSTHNSILGPLHTNANFDAIHEINPMSPPKMNNGGSSQPLCPFCKEADTGLMAAQADLEYLRSIALRNEYHCAMCENQSKRKKKHFGSDSTPLNEASQRLVDAMARHKRQVEQMTRERAQWQQDMHFKLSKFAMICKQLNEESAIRNEEALMLEAELHATQSERNKLVSEVQTLRAQEELYRAEREEHTTLRETMKQYEDDGLNVATDSIQKRDSIITDLSRRLEQTLDTLEMERQRQRQRRQIIFSSPRPQQQYSNPNIPQLVPLQPSAKHESPVEAQRLADDLEKAKDESRAAQMALEAATIAAAKKEQALKDHIAQLEKVGDARKHSKSM